MGETSKELECLLDDYDGATSQTRNATERSELAEGLVHTFLSRRADKASVRWKASGFGLNELYRSLRSTCSKYPYKGHVEVSKRGDALILVRTHHQ